MLSPLILSYVLDDGVQAVYDEIFLLTVSSGFFSLVPLQNHRRDLNVRGWFLLVVLVWTVLPIFAAFPFMFHLNMSHTDAYFEAVSGLTATGATVISDWLICLNQSILAASNDVVLAAWA